MHHVIVNETAHDVRDGIDLADVGEEFVAETLAGGGTLDDARDIHELDRGRQDTLRLDDGGERIEPRVGHRHDADVRLDGAERVVLGRDGRARERVEEGRLANIGQADDAAFDSHAMCP